MYKVESVTRNFAMRILNRFCLKRSYYHDAQKDIAYTAILLEYIQLLLLNLKVDDETISVTTCVTSYFSLLILAWLVTQKNSSYSVIRRMSHIWNNNRSLKNEKKFIEIFITWRVQMWNLFFVIQVHSGDIKYRKFRNQLIFPIEAKQISILLDNFVILLQSTSFCSQSPFSTYCINDMFDFKTNYRIFSTVLGALFVPLKQTVTWFLFLFSSKTILTNTHNYIYCFCEVSSAFWLVFF